MNLLHFEVTFTGFERWLVLFEGVYSEALDDGDVRLTATFAHGL